MEFKVLEKTDNMLEVKVLDADDTVMYPVVEQILQDERVENATYSVKHQDLDDPILQIEAKEGDNATQILIDTSENLTDKFSEVHSELFEEEE